MPKIEKEFNDIIFKHAEIDVNSYLADLKGENFKKYREDFKKAENYLKSGFIPEFPITISLELVNRCNLNCVMCYKDHHKKEFAKLPIKTIRKLLQEAKQHSLPSIILGLGSETLMYPEVSKVLNEIADAGVMDVFFGTNGVMLNEEICKKLIKTKVSRIEISLDAATTGTYEKVRGANKLELIENNIDMLLRMKKDMNSPLPVVRLCFVVQDINNHETDVFIKKWKDKVDYIDFQRCLDFSKMNQTLEIKPDVVKNSFCSYPYYSLNIWSNGDVSPCCTFYGRGLVFGNIFDQTLKEIWDSKAMKLIREELESKRFNPICIKCLYFRDRELIDNTFK